MEPGDKVIITDERYTKWSGTIDKIVSGGDNVIALLGDVKRPDGSEFGFPAAAHTKDLLRSHHP